MKIKQILLSVFALVIPMFMMIGNTNAANNDSTITYQRINGAYFYLQNKTTGAVDTNHVTKFFMNGRIAYCIEPMVDINEKTFNSTSNWNITSISPETRRYIEKVGYFGYEYPGHQTDKYWLATQALIWEKANSNVSVKFTTGENGSGSVINLSNERNEILRLMEQYDKTASFAQTTVEGNIGDEITLTDENGVLSSFNMSYSGKHQVTRDGNNLKIKLNETSIGEDLITFRKSSYDSQVSVIYYKSNSQKLASLRISDPTTFRLNIKSNGGTVEVDKTGEKLVLDDASYKYETIKLPNVTFALYANEDIKDGNGNILYKKYQLVDTLKTDENGIAILSDLYFGKYFLIEGESSLGNMVNVERYYFEITRDDLVDGKIVKKLDFANYLPKGTLEFTKKDLASGKAIPNTTIQIFNDEDRLIYTGITDKNGKIVIPDLSLGKYYLIEKAPADGYQMTNEKIYFEITENGEVVKLEMTNERVIVPDTNKEDIAKFAPLFFVSLMVLGICVHAIRDRKQK